MNGAPSARPPLLALFSVTMVGIMGTTLVSPVLPDVLDDLGQPEGRAGLIIAAVALPGVLVAPLIGVLADRWGRRRVLLPCLVLFGVGGVLAGLAPAFGLLLVARLVQGFGAAGLINLVVVLIADHWSGEERARLLGLNSAVLTVFIAVMPLVGGLLAEWGTWRWSFGAYGVALLVAGLILIVVPADAAPGQTGSMADQLRASAALLSDRRLRVAVASAVVLFVGIFGVSLTVLPLIAEQRFGLGSAARGALLASTAIGSTTTSLLSARIQSALGRVAAVRGGSLLFLVGVLAVALAPHPALLVVAAIITGLAEGMVIPTLQVVVTELAPMERRGAAVAVFVSGTRAGQTLGPLVAGIALSVTSTAAGAAGWLLVLLVPVTAILIPAQGLLPDRIPNG